MSLAYQARNMHPALYLVPREQGVGVYALMIVMSQAHYGLIVCVRDTNEFRALSVTELSREIVEPWASQLPYLVDMYHERFRHKVEQLPELRLDVPYSFEIINIKNLDVMLREYGSGYAERSDDHGHESQYVFIAPDGVPFEEFITFAEGSLLN